METSKVISKIKGIFNSSFPAEDKRCKIQQPTFIAAFVCGLLTQDGRTKSLGGLRLSVASLTSILLSRGAFWDRMASRRLTKHLMVLLTSLISEVRVGLEVGSSILQALSVSKILMLDSSSFSLPDAASGAFPAPRNNVVPAAMKVHMLYDLFGGIGKWFQITPATTHDRKGFPPLELLRGALIIFDLGYWDFQLLNDMIIQKVMFLSRVKSNARVGVIEVIKGISETCVGLDMHSGRLDAFRGEIVEFIGEFIIPRTKNRFRCRIVGFWSPIDHAYHWYATNLKVASIVVYPLYRLRWQLELVWKSWKSIIHLDEITSSDSTVILNMALGGMSAGLIAGAISIATVNESPKEKQLGFSIQRSASFLLRIARELYQHLTSAVRSGKTELMKMIQLFSGELIDPNVNNRVTSIGRVHFQLRP